MISSITTLPIFLSACNAGTRNIPYCGEVLRRVTGLPFKHGDKITPIRFNNYLDLPLFEGDTKYLVQTKEVLTIRNPIYGYYDNDKRFQIINAPLTNHYLVDGEFYNTVSHRNVKTSLYIPIEVIHRNFQLLNH